jgi:hypothetical protein
MSGKRIVFSTVTPNDQGGVIPNSTIDFTSRFNANPVVLCQHDWNAPPLGLMTDIKEENGELSGIPVFNKITEDSKTYAALYEGGWIKACSIGGEAEWKTNNAGQPVLTKEGHRQCEKFVLYEISIVTLPSNPDAVTKEQLAAKIYEQADLQGISDKIVTLSSKYKIPIMEPVTKTPEELAVETAEKDLADKKAKLEAAKKTTLGNNSPSDPSAGQLPGVIKEIVRSHDTTVGRLIDFLMGGKKVEPTKLEVPTPKDKPESHISDPTQTQPTPIGLDAKRAEAKKKAEESKKKAEEATAAAASAKEKAEKEGASAEDKDGYAAAYSAAEKACNEALEAEEHYKSCMDATDDEDMAAREKAAKEKKAAGAPAKTTLAAGAPAPKLKTMEELQSSLKLAAPPEHRAKIMTAKGVPFSKLTAKDNEEGQRILGRVMTPDSGKDISDYAILLDSIMNDGKFAAIVEKTRVIANISEGQFNSYRQSGISKERAGFGLKEIAQQLHSGVVDILGRDNVMHKRTTLSTTDNALASPALNTIEWLSLAIFNLFPTTSWKNDIPMFGAQMTSENTGLIWANVAADPTITFGTQPVNPANYTYSDTAVALTLIPSWLQPMLWTPLTMHQLRYDQMSTGWAQAFAKWGSLIDDKLIFTLASTVPAGSIIQTLGQPLNPSFTLAANTANPNNFYYNPAFAGSLSTPAYNDITRIEQLYNQQNFDLTREKAVLVLDPTAEAFISLDPDTKSLLTRWITSDQADLLKIKHTKLDLRSRVAIYDPATGQVKDPAGVIPSTAVSAMIGFLPSQVGIGLGILDVFMIQDPTSYGYKMSADIREGIVPMRANFNGTTLYTYGPAVNAPANV